jgi:hypothetical protein
MDPRVKTSTADLQAQFDLSKQMYDGLVEVATGIDEIDVLRQQLKKQKGETAEAFDKKLEAVEGQSSRGGRGAAAQTGPPTLLAVRSQLNRLQQEMQSADVAPTSAMVVACAASKQQLTAAMARWQALKSTELPKVNAHLKKAKLPTLALDTSLLLKNRDTNFHPESTEEVEEQ